MVFKLRKYKKNNGNNEMKNNNEKHKKTVGNTRACNGLGGAKTDAQTHFTKARQILACTMLARF